MERVATKSDRVIAKVEHVEHERLLVPKTISNTVVDTVRRTFTYEVEVPLPSAGRNLVKVPCGKCGRSLEIYLRSPAAARAASWRMFAAGVVLAVLVGFYLFGDHAWIQGKMKIVARIIVGVAAVVGFFLIISPLMWRHASVGLTSSPANPGWHTVSFDRTI